VALSAGAHRRPSLVDQRCGGLSGDYPGWQVEYPLERLLREIDERNVERWRQ